MARPELILWQLINLHGESFKFFFLIKMKIYELKDKDDDKVDRG